MSEEKKILLDNNDAECLAIRAANPGCYFPACMCRVHCEFEREKKPENPVKPEAEKS